jgi:heme/copper-type cytochrome/quinol oxidase subunit 2
MEFIFIGGYIFIAITVYLITFFIDSRRLGKREITQEEAGDETEDNAIIAIFWPIAALFLIIFELMYSIGEGVRKIGENTIKHSSYKNDTNSNCSNLSGGCTCN